MVRGFVSFLFCLGVCSTLIFSQHKVMIPGGSFVTSYNDYFVTVSTSNIQFYKKDIDLDWLLDSREFDLSSVDILFNRLFILDKQHALHTFLIKDSFSKQQLSEGAVDLFSVHMPMVLYHTQQGKLVNKLVSTDQTLWSQEIMCQDISFLASGEYVGCASKTELTVFNSVSGKKSYSTPLKSGDWVFETSWNSGFVMSQDNKKMVKISIPDFSFETLSITKDKTAGWVRQKEAVLFNTSSNLISCLDIDSNKSRWTAYFKHPVKSVVMRDNNVLVRTVSENVKVIDTFKGDVKGEFDFSNWLTDPYHFYQYKSEWYFFIEDFILKMKQHILPTSNDKKKFDQI